MHAEQPDERAEPLAADTPAATGEEGRVAEAVDDQARRSDGAAAEQEPEVPDDARETIARAERHLDDVDMQQERKSLEETQKDM